eukprot:11869622-Karenia_brevis.AAC.1
MDFVGAASCFLGCLFIPGLCYRRRSDTAVFWSLGNHVACGMGIKMNQFNVHHTEERKEIYYSWPMNTTKEDLAENLVKMFCTSLLPDQWLHVPTEVPPPPCVPDVTIDGVALKEEGL